MQIDLHTHTAAASSCSHILPKEMVAAAIEVGLDGLCVTDHVFDGLTLRHDPSQSYAGYHAVRQAAEGSGLVVLPGIEFTFDEGDFLVYGLDEATLLELGEDYCLEMCLALAHREGSVVVQAHPFRYRGQPVRGVDAIETCNGGSSDEHNRKAKAWSRESGVLGLAGSDAHQKREVGRCYTVFDADCSTVAGLCDAIRRRRVHDLKHRHVLRPKALPK
jgi:predicted metal-dependent phosphoesterase TrpH